MLDHASQNEECLRCQPVKLLHQEVERDLVIDGVQVKLTVALVLRLKPTAKGKPPMPQDTEGKSNG